MTPFSRFHASKSEIANEKLIMARRSAAQKITSAQPASILDNLKRIRLNVFGSITSGIFKALDKLSRNENVAGLATWKLGDSKRDIGKSSSSLVTVSILAICVVLGAMFSRAGNWQTLNNYQKEIVRIQQYKEARLFNASLVVSYHDTNQLCMIII